MACRYETRVKVYGSAGILKQKTKLGDLPSLAVARSQRASVAFWHDQPTLDLKSRSSTSRCENDHDLFTNQFYSAHLNLRIDLKTICIPNHFRTCSERQSENDSTFELVLRVGILSGKYAANLSNTVAVAIIAPHERAMHLKQHPLSSSREFAASGLRQQLRSLGRDRRLAARSPQAS